MSEKAPYQGSVSEQGDAREKQKGKDAVSVVEHEGAFVGSLSCSLEGDYGAVVEAVRQKLSTLAGWVGQNGGVVGHIKATVTEAQTVTMLSTTGDDVAAMPVKAANNQVDAVAIVFGVEEGPLRKTMTELFFG